MSTQKDRLTIHHRLVNLAMSPGVKYKQSPMPFVQMENISHFLRACELPPLNLPSHDRFLTVDLYDSKDPAQVLQCISAFSRRANIINPGRFPTTIGAKSKGSTVSPQLTGSSQGGYSKSPDPVHRDGAMSNSSNTSSTVFNPLAKASYSGRVSPTKASSLSKGGLATGGPVSSWSNRNDEGTTAPAWNIHQYGYMGGASQGNQGISFGARRQITSAAPQVPSLAEKEKRRREEALEAERQRQEAEEAERLRKTQLEDQERRAREEEEQRWAEETRRLREKERREAEEEKQRWDEEQKRWKEEEDARLREEKELEARLAAERNRSRETRDTRLNGQFLSQYQADQVRRPGPSIDTQSPSESQRIAELERQLEEAKRREQEYEKERQTRLREDQAQNEARQPRTMTPPPPALPARPTAPEQSREDDWQTSERDFLRTEWQKSQNQTHLPTPPKPPRPTPAEPIAPPKPTPSPRPLPDPTTFAPATNRTDRFLESHPAPPLAQPTSHRPQDYSTTTEVDLEDQRRKASQAKTKAGGWASKSLLEREMERERERQREWEEDQKRNEAATRDTREGVGPGQSWDVHQYGYMGGDSQNRGGPGLGVGGARRQIIGPRPPP